MWLEITEDYAEILLLCSAYFLIFPLNIMLVRNLSMSLCGQYIENLKEISKFL